MKLNRKGQVTISGELRERHGLHTGDEIRVDERGAELVIVKDPTAPTHGERLVARLQGLATGT